MVKFSLGVIWIPWLLDKSVCDQRKCEV